MKKTSFLRVALVLVCLLAGAALASAQRQIVLAGGSQGVTLDAITATSGQVSFGTCNDSICSMSGTGAVVNSTGSAVSAGIWNLALSGGPVTVSNTGAFDRSPVGTFTYKGETGRTGTLAGTFTLALLGGGSQPQFNITMHDVSGTDSFAAMFPQGSSTELRYRLTQRLCSSSDATGCTFQERLNSAGTSAWRWRPHGRLTPPSEPAAAFVLGTGLLGLSVILRRRRKLTHTEV